MKLTRMVATFLLLVLLIAGCSQLSDDPGRNPFPVVPPATLAGDPPLDDLEYETISGTLTPGTGGAMGIFSRTWPKNCWFGLIVPPDALDESYGPVAFTMQFPTYESYLEHPEIGGTIPMRFEPSGLPFLANITVYATWMPWEGTPPTALQAVEIDGSEINAVTVVPLPEIHRYRLTFQTNHFSDWEVNRGPGEPEPDPDMNEGF